MKSIKITIIIFYKITNIGDLEQFVLSLEFGGRKYEANRERHGMPVSVCNKDVNKFRICFTEDL